MRCTLAPGLCNAAVLVTNAQDALEGWRDTVRDHLAHDPTRQIGRHHPKLATSVTGAFPEEGVVVSYIHPAVSARTALPAVREPQASDVATLGALVQQQLGWDDPQRLLDTFSQHVWPAVVMQEILRDLNVWIPQPVYGAWAALTNCSRSSSLSPLSARVPAEVRVCAVL